MAVCYEEMNVRYSVRWCSRGGADDGNMMMMEQVGTPERRSVDHTLVKASALGHSQ